MSGFQKAVWLGIAAGMRSMLAPAIASNYFVQNDAKVEESPLKYLASESVAKILAVAAAGELIADKLPCIPSRISPGPLTGRAISGAICGAAICAASGERRDVGALTGGLAAVVSAFAFYNLRRKLSASTRLPDPVLALSEDLIAIKIARHALKA